MLGNTCELVHVPDFFGSTVNLGAKMLIDSGMPREAALGMKGCVFLYLNDR